MADISAKQLGLCKSNLPRSIVEVISTLTKAGYKAYIVGGGVRDNLLALDPKDFDAVTDAKPHEIKEVFGKRCRIIGRRFQLAHVYSGREMIEVATFRGDPKDNSHTNEEGMILRDNVWGDIKQDFVRRDFSINALYYQPMTETIKDFCHAIDDINNKTLRLLGDAQTRIEEDPVRLLRALRFKAKLGFEFDEALEKQFNPTNWALLEQVSHHRLYDETQKMFTGGYSSALLPLLYEYGAMKHLFLHSPPQASNLIKKIADNTDKRIADNNNINPAFFYAGLLWEQYLYQLNKSKKKHKSFLEAQKKSAAMVINRQRVRTAIPKFAEQFICNIWLLQPKLADPKAKNILQISEHPRFRAGFDFLLLREQCDEADTPLAEPTNGMGEWWEHFQTLNEKEQFKVIKQFGAEMSNDKDSKKISTNSQRKSVKNQQDIDEKSQLKLLVLNGDGERSKHKPLPLFTVNTKDKKQTPKRDKRPVKSKKSNEQNTLVLSATEVTPLQEILLNTPYVPKIRQRKHF